MAANKKIKLSYKEILKISLKKGQEKHLYVLLYRIIAVPFVKLFLNFNISPNMITILSFLLGVASAVSYILYKPILAIVLFQLSWIADLVDGPIARIKKQFSEKGGWMDSFFDRVNVNLLLVAITLGISFHYGSNIVLILGLILVAIRNTRIYSESLIDNMFGYDEAVQSKKEVLKSKFSLITKTFQMFLDVVIFILPFIVLFNLPFIVTFYIVYSITELFRMIIDVLFVIRK